LFLILSGFIFLLSLTGCVTLNDIEASQEQNPVVVGVIDPEHSLGQSFISRRGRMNTITLWLSLVPDQPADQGTLTARLFHSPEEQTPIREIHLAFQDIARTTPLTLTFSPLADPPGQAYFLSLHVSEGRVLAYGRDADVYPHGNLYINGATSQADLAFRLSYDYEGTALIEDGYKLLHEAWLLFPLVAILLLPGWLLLDSAGIKFSAALALGLSLSLIPLLMTWSSTLGIVWDRERVLGISLALGLLALWRLWSRRRQVQGFPFTVHAISLAAIFALAFMVRLIMVRDLSAPPWVDSVHHGTITRLILERGQLPETYAPYINIDNARYHSGYHVILATFIWLSALDLPQAMLILGQVLNASMVLAVYLFTTTLTRDRMAGVFAALISGVITPMPAYYTSWGRYTQLTGLLILPTSYKLIRDLIEKQASLFPRASLTQGIKQNWKDYLLASISCAGLFLIHYRVIAFLGCLLIADYIIRRLRECFGRVRTKWSKTEGASNNTNNTTPLPQPFTLFDSLVQEIITITIVAFLSILFILPWLPATLTSLFIPKLSLWQGARTAAFDGFAWNYLTAAWGKYSLYLAGLGILWSVLRRPSFVPTLILWTGLLFLLANLGVWGLAGSGFINNTSVAITLFIPISTLGGYFLAQLLALRKRLAREWMRIAYTLVFGSVSLVLALQAARHLLPILNPITFLFRPEDARAAAWIAQHIPPDETIVINPFAWGYGLFAGNDGGYWITPLSGRKTLPPPVLYALDNNIENVKHMNALIQQIINYGQNPEQLYALLKENGLNYLFIGRRGGIFSPRLLEESPLFRVIYKAEGTWVFQLK